MQAAAFQHARSMRLEGTHLHVYGARLQSLCSLRLQSAALSVCSAVRLGGDFVDGQEQALHALVLAVNDIADGFALELGEPPGAPGSLQRLNWHVWPEQGSPEHHDAGGAYAHATAWASMPV